MKISLWLLSISIKHLINFHKIKTLTACMLYPLLEVTLTHYSTKQLIMKIRGLKFKRQRHLWIEP
jgi:hypothetical protein